MRPGAGAEGSTNGATFGRAGAGSAADRRTPAGNVNKISDGSENIEAWVAEAAD